MNFDKDLELLKKLNKKYLIGLDEVGRGSLSGPLVSCSCIILNRDIQGIKDSKQLSDMKRRKICHLLKDPKNCLYGIGDVSVEEINKKKLTESVRLSFTRSIKDLFTKYDIKESDCAILIDGNTNFDITNALNSIKGDMEYMSIAAASIIAKVYRDDLMIRLSCIPRYILYKWENNKGYGTEEHIRAIKDIGICDQHRIKFVKKYVQSD